MWIIELNGLFFMATCDTCPRCGFSARTSGLLREIGGRRSPERVNSLVKFPRCLAWFFMVGSQFPINIIKYSWFLTGDWEGLPRNIGNWPWNEHELTMKPWNLWISSKNVDGGWPCWSCSTRWGVHPPAGKTQKIWWMKWEFSQNYPLVI